MVHKYTVHSWMPPDPGKRRKGGFGATQGKPRRDFLLHSAPSSEVRSFFTLPALQKNLWISFFRVFAWEFCIEKWRGFFVNFFWSPSPTKRSTKSPRKIRGKFGVKFGMKLREIRETFVLQLFWPNVFPEREATIGETENVTAKGARAWIDHQWSKISYHVLWANMTFYDVLGKQRTLSEDVIKQMSEDFARCLSVDSPAWISSKNSVISLEKIGINFKSVPGSAQHQRRKTYTTTTERKSFGEPFWPQRKTFQIGGGYKNAMKTRKTISTTEIFPLWPPFLFGKEKFCTGAGRCRLPFFPEHWQQSIVGLL